ncbi:MAG: hypothetical protein Q8P20_04970 [bacterium]|nr:hypothetical protein [bacterium]
MPADIESLWLKINYFFLTNRDDLKKWWVILLIAADVFIVVFVFTNSIIYIIGFSKQNDLILAMSRSPIDYAAVREESKPSSLEIITTAAIKNANDKYDLIAQIKNPNKDWVVESIKYKFVINGQATDSFTDYIMPNSDKYLTMLSTEASNNADNITLSMEIEEIIWEREPDINKLVNIDFVIENIEYSTFTSAGGVQVNNVDAEVTNNAFKGFWQTRFVVVLYNGTKIVGVNHVYLDEFKAGETKNLKSQWSYLPASASTITILPDMDLTDIDNII